MRSFLTTLLMACLAWPLLANEPASAVSREQALSELRNGNSRFVAGTPHAWAAGTAKRELLTKGQHPLACVITCSDSRVSPEILFDQSLGSVFVVRLAGNVVSPEAVGSVEYAVEHLHVPLVVVLGHSSCGAVSAALAEPDMEGPIATLINRIKPSIDAAKQKGFAGDELAGAVITENARHGAEELVHDSRAVDEAVQKGSVTVLSATYDLKTGRVAWQTQLSAPAFDAAVATTPAGEKPATEAKTATSATPKTAVAAHKEEYKPATKIFGEPQPAPKKPAHDAASYAGRR
ncbi:MAG TPA: carbonic anhydrase [bacterium]|jgi:carbonic anhydrase